MSSVSESAVSVDLSWLKGKSIVITGGCGYFAKRLCTALAKNGAARVQLFDVRELEERTLKRLKATAGATVVEAVVGDVRQPEHVNRLLAGRVDACFHAASFGMSGHEQVAQTSLIEAINVGGTENIINGCKLNKVPVLVYTSTYNVVFGGSSPPAFRGVTEDDAPYLPLEKHTDAYSRTKSMAEQRVLAAASKSLRVCALRAAAIYGEGEERHLPRVVKVIRQGLVRFTIGDPEGKHDFVHVDNLVHAHLLAAVALGANKSPGGGDAPQGRAYFISDGEPINNFDFFMPLVDLYGFSRPFINIPYLLAFYIAMLLELLHRVLSPIVKFQPLLTTAEVNKVGVCHFFSIENARKDLNYTPIVTTAEGMKRVLNHFRMNPTPAPEPFLSTGLRIFLLACGYILLRQFTVWLVIGFCLMFLFWRVFRLVKS